MTTKQKKMLSLVALGGGAAFLIYKLMGNARAKAISIIKEFEGLEVLNDDGSVSAYYDQGGVPTIGWGTTRYSNGQDVRIGDTITQARAEQELNSEVDEKQQGVKELVTVPLSENQLAALISLAYNIGLGALQSSSLLRKLNQGSNMQDVANEFDRWVNVNGAPVSGLIRRRKEEKQLFLS